MRTRCDSFLQVRSSTVRFIVLNVVDFDYRHAIEEDIVRFGRALKGTAVGQIAGALLGAPTPAQGKGEVGLAIERYFGIPQNSRSEADFPGAGVELKIVPMVRSSGRLVVKERTSLTMINYMNIVNETWETAHVRTKLKILFVFVEHLPGRPKKEFPIRQVLLWKPSPRQGALLRTDWERVRDTVEKGLAHELRESEGRIMGPATKAAHSRARRPQPVTTFSSHAKPRAFALKPSFTKALYDDSMHRGPIESLIENLSLAEVNRFEHEVFRRFDRYVGLTLGEVGDSLEVPGSTGKGYIGAVLRRAFGAHSPRAKIREFEEMGISVKTTRISPDGMPYEAMSFPAFRYLELIEEIWEESTLLTQLDGLLFVPCLGVTKSTPHADCVIQQPFLWRPQATQFETLRAEWEMFRDAIRAGNADRLPTAASTEMIHVRPHARDSSDTDVAPVVGPVVKKSFWLNRAFVARLVAASQN